MPATQNESPNHQRRKCARWTEEEDRTLLRLRKADSEISFHKFQRNYQVYFPDRTASALEQRYRNLENAGKDGRKDTQKARITILKVPKRPVAPTAEAMAQSGPCKQPRLGGQQEVGMDCDIAPQIQIGELLPNHAQYPQCTAPQAPITVPPPSFAFQPGNVLGTPQFQPSFSSSSYRPVPATGQTSPYISADASFIQANRQIPAQNDTAISDTNFNTRETQAPPPAPAQGTQQTDSQTMAESQASSDAEESDETSSTTDSELPDPDSLWHHNPGTSRERAISPQQGSSFASTSSAEGCTTTQEEITPKKAETTPNVEPLPPVTRKLLDGLSEEQFDEVQLNIICRRSQMRELKNIQREMEAAGLRRRIEELEGRLTAQNKQIQILESAGSQHFAALEKQIVDLVARGKDDRRRLEKVEGFIEMNKQLHNSWNAQEGKSATAGKVGL